MSVRTFLLPDLGEGLTEAELVNWLVAEGDTVVVDQPVAEVETAKSLVEVPSPFAGTIARLHGEAGDSIDVGRPLISVETSAAAPETSVAAAPEAGVGASPEGEAYRQEERAGSGNVLIGYGTPESGLAPRRTRAPRRRMAAPAAPVAAVPVRTEAPRCVSPLVRRMARDAGVKLTDLSGTGPEGLILRRDVEAEVASRAAATARVAEGVRSGVAQDEVAQREVVEGEVVEAAGRAARDAAETRDVRAARDVRTGLGVISRTPVRGVRRTIAANLSRSRSLIPEATVWVDVDATPLMELRDVLSEQRQDVPSLLAFLARFTLAGLALFPALNTRFVAAGDSSGSPAEGEEHEAAIEAFDGINLGIAVQTGRGLMVPSVRRADALSTRDLDAEIRRLTTAAQDGRATPGELSSGTFTLNNYGVYGVDGSAAIINYPESAILGVGRIIDKPWVVSGQLAVRKVTQLTLVFDHRVCDGATAGGFLRYVADAVENPGRVLADL
ncbi:dihydrolipoamide acetyltransferase family protein [Arthrobacter sp. zg-Y877]|uniref:dihydrolipoamide acetyltransferase family protein n=1 Tax=Arthrobacter sp. zg-Y877 TaxID=3049074 RepID=UPI0025A3B3B8|nr:dihydrolipoamide acetyltransferase family protein [Arthrobacter sp. zg-Y877]MDM7990130.1 dihydrolipoamide acetyltransferase family protein [Arthrobacter sp. zg-Y877]